MTSPSPDETPTDQIPVVPAPPVDQEGLGAGPPPPKSVQVLATLALIVVSLAAVFAVVYASVVKSDTSATTLLGTLVTAVIAALVVLSGGRHSE